MAKGGEGKVSSGLVAASCAAILAVYTAGYSRTRDAAEKFDTQAQERRPASRSERTVAAVQPEETPVASGEAVAQRNEPTTSARVDAPASAVIATEQVPRQIETPAAVAAPVETAMVSAPTPAPTPAAAPEPTAPVAPKAVPVAPKWKDGTYTGWGTSRHGDIEARVVVHEGRIAEAGISQCLTRYSCDVIDTLIPQPVQRQSPDIDYVSRATESSDAYYFALREALEKAAISPSSSSSAQ
jgi:uncharacterized protein with FMN-binding domain